MWFLRSESCVVVLVGGAAFLLPDCSLFLCASCCSGSGSVFCVLLFLRLHFEVSLRLLLRGGSCVVVFASGTFFHFASHFVVLLAVGVLGVFFCGMQFVALAVLCFVMVVPEWWVLYCRPRCFFLVYLLFLAGTAQ